MLPSYAGHSLWDNETSPARNPPSHVYFNSYGGGGVVLIYFMLICSGAERGENGSECRECAKEKEQER